MLQSIRDRFTGAMAIVIIGAIGIALTITLVDTDTFTGITNFAARVNDEEIALTDFRQVAQQQVLEQEQASRTQLSEADKLQIERNVLEGMIRNRVVSQYVSDAGYRVSDARVVEAIRGLPAFQVNGRFSNDGYLAALASQGVSPAVFEQERRAAIQIEQLQNGVLDSAFFTPAEYRRFVMLEGERRQAAFAIMSPQPLAASTAVSEDEIKAYYDTHPDRFESQESATIDYVEVKAADLPPAAEPTEAEIRAAYEAAADRYEAAAQRRARHILVAVDADTSDKAAQDLATQIRARLDKGEDFAALARQYSDDTGSAAAGGELGWAGKGTYVEPFEAVLFTQNVGDISQPVKTDFGYHIIQLEEVREGSRRSFEDARAEIAAELRGRGAQDRFFEMTEKMDDSALQNPGNLDAVAQAAGAPIRRIENFTRAGGEPLGAVRAVIDAVFSAQVLEDGENSPLIEAGEGRALILRVVEHRPVRLRPLAEVRGEIEAAVRTEKAARLVAERGARLVEAVRTGGDLATLATEAGAAQKASLQLLGRNSPDVPPALLEAIFRAPRPVADKPAVDGVALPDGSYAVFRIESVLPGNPEDIPPDQRDARKGLLARQMGVAEITALAVDLRNEADVVVAPDLFDEAD